MAEPDDPGGSKEFDNKLREAMRRRNMLRDMLLHPPPKFDAGQVMRLQELSDQVIDHLRKKWGSDKQCPYCQATDWQVGKLVWFDLEDGSKYPAVPVLCGNCANTTFINPLAAGLSMPADDET